MFRFDGIQRRKLLTKIGDLGFTNHVIKHVNNNLCVIFRKYDKHKGSSLILDVRRNIIISDGVKFSQIGWKDLHNFTDNKQYRLYKWDSRLMIRIFKYEGKIYLATLNRVMELSSIKNNKLRGIDLNTMFSLNHNYSPYVYHFNFIPSNDCLVYLGFRVSFLPSNTNLPMQEIDFYQRFNPVLSDSYSEAIVMGTLVRNIPVTDENLIYSFERKSKYPNILADEIFVYHDFMNDIYYFIR